MIFLKWLISLWVSSVQKISRTAFRLRIPSMYPDKKRRFLRGLEIIALGLTFTAAGVVVVAWRQLGRHLNSPGFQAALEKGFSTKWDGRFALESLQSHLGVRPWVEITGVTFEADNGDFRWSAKSAGIHVRILPLLRRRLVFSQGFIMAPHVWVRRRPNGEPPDLPDLNKRSEPGGGFEVRLNDVQVEGAELVFVDQSRPEHPHLTLRADAAFRRVDEAMTLDMTGRIDGIQGRGRYRATGRFQREKESAFHVEASGFPLGLMGEFVPAIASWTGTLNFEGDLAGRKNQWRWSTKGEAAALRVNDATPTLPMTLSWNLSSFSTSTARAVWVSTGSNVRVEAILPNILQPYVDVRVLGESLDVGEILEWGRRIPAAPQREGRASPALTVTARTELERVNWGKWTAARVSGTGEWANGLGRLNRFQCEVFQGTMTVRGQARSPRRPTAPWIVGAALDVSGLRADELGRLWGSSGTWTGVISGSATVTDMPISRTGLFWALAQTRVLDASFSGDALGWKSWVLTLAKFNLRRVGQEWEALLLGQRGPSSFSLRATLPAGGPIASKQSPPATLRADINDIDLEALGGLVPALGFQRGQASASGAWRSKVNPDLRQNYMFGPSSQWDFDVRLASADWKGVPIDGLSGRMRFGSDRILRINDFRGRLSGGTLEGEATAVGFGEAGPVTFTAYAALRDMETKELMTAISTHAYLVQGRFDGSLSLSGPLRPWNAQKLNGQIGIVGRNGSFRAAPAVLEVFSALKIRSLLQWASGQKTAGLPFDVIEASCPIRNGRYLLDQPLIFNNYAFQMAYTGWMDVRFANGKGTLLFNFLQGTTDMIRLIPGVSSLVLGPEGEFLPLVVDVTVADGKTDVRTRSLQTLTGPLVNVVKNVFRLPFRLFRPTKKEKKTEP